MDAADDRRYEETKGMLTAVGYFCRGTVLCRLMPCGKPGCRCQATPPRLHGPYYQWTRKVQGKTVTVRISAREAKLVRQGIANARRFDAVASRMERISLLAIDRARRELRSEVTNPSDSPQPAPSAARTARGATRRTSPKKGET